MSKTTKEERPIMYQNQAVNNSHEPEVDRIPISHMVRADDSVNLEKCLLTRKELE